MDRISAAEVLFTKTQQRLLRALFALPPGSAGMTYSDLMRLTSAGAGGIHRELQQFVRAGLVSERHAGGRRFYLPNKTHPIYKELRGVAQKLLGISAALKEALAPFASRIERAFIYGSVAKNAEGAQSDIDVMVIGTCPVEKVLAAVQALEPTFLRHISVRFFNPEEYRRLSASDGFVRSVEAGPVIELIERAPKRIEASAPGSPRRKRAKP